MTPSERSSAWLKLCIASVADQQVELEHIVQDASSDDGTLEWLPHDRRVRAFVEKDDGMYDAINRGLRQATGDIAAYLNCDEQYLPGALLAVETFFKEHPAIDLVFSDVVMVGPDGHYRFHRRMQTPLKYHTLTCHLSTLSCATFFRRHLVSEQNLWFDARLRNAGDGEWMVRLLRRGVRMGVLRRFTSAFTCTGANKGASPHARLENRELRLTAPGWVQALRPLIIAHHRLRRWFGGMYLQRPFYYEIYSQTSPRKRQRFEVTRPVARGSYVQVS